MPRTDWGWQITEEELRGWILHQDDRLLVINKPGLVLCHPSKHGPWSSLIGACREYLGVARLHMPSRLDRETSGVVVLARDAELGSKLQRAIMHRQVEKIYFALLSGRLEHAVTVNQPIGKASDSAVIVRRAVSSDGQAAVTRFEPAAWDGSRGPSGVTLARIIPETGRLHQIRVHAAWLGHPVLGDKIYGPDERLFLEFLERGWTERHQRELEGWPHQALHAAVWKCASLGLEFQAPLPESWGDRWEASSIETIAKPCCNGSRS